MQISEAENGLMTSISLLKSRIMCCRLRRRRIAAAANWRKI